MYKFLLKHLSHNCKECLLGKYFLKKKTCFQEFVLTACGSSFALNLYIYTCNMSCTYHVYTNNSQISAHRTADDKNILLQINMEE